VRISSQWLVAACLLFAAAPPSLSARTAPTEADVPLESVVITQVDGWIDVSPSGEIVAFQTDTTLAPALRQNLERTVLRWRVQPVLIDGAPHQVRAKTRVVLAASRIGEKYSVKIDNVTFPNETDTAADASNPDVSGFSGKQLRAPRYPASLLQAGVSGKVLLCLRVGADGRPEEVVAVQTMLYDVKGLDRNLRKAIALMEDSAVSAARGWTFNLSAERAAQSAEYRTAKVPVEYMMGSKPVPEKPGQWRTVVRVPMRKVDWLPASSDSQKIGVSDMAAGEVMTADSVVKLDSNVVGTVVM
jgi:hypothetical protein